MSQKLAEGYIKLAQGYEEININAIFFNIEKKNLCGMKQKNII